MWGQGGVRGAPSPGVRPELNLQGPSRALSREIRWQRELPVVGRRLAQWAGPALTGRRGLAEGGTVRLVFLPPLRVSLLSESSSPEHLPTPNQCRACISPSSPTT